MKNYKETANNYEKEEEYFKGVDDKKYSKLKTDCEN